MSTQTQLRPLYEIAQDALASDSLKGNTRIYAEAYLKPMLSLSSVQENYMYDSGESIVIYALANLQHWRGDTAKRIKAELKAHLGK
jgi:hypothetical protein